MGLLYKFFEADNLEVACDTPLKAGQAHRDYTIPANEVWQIHRVTGSASAGNCEIEFLHSSDKGVTWTNPFDAGITKLSCLHMANGNPVDKTFPAGFEFKGSSDQVILRLVSKNYNTDKIAEVVATLEGQIR